MFAGQKQCLSVIKYKACHDIFKNNSNTKGCKDVAHNEIYTVCSILV